MMSMIAAAILLATIPFFYALSMSITYRKYVYILVGLAPFVINFANLDAALVDWAYWPGYVKGLIITMVDILAVAIIFSHKGKLKRIPFVGIFWLYIACVAVSLVVSYNWISSSFYLFQLIRVLLLFLAVAAIAQTPQSIRWLAIGLALGAIFQSIVAVDQRLSGTFQVSGTFGHQNLLGMMLHFVALPLMALLLAGGRSKIMIAGLGASVLVVALGASRGTIGFLSIGTVLLVALTLIRRPTAAKWRATGVVMALFLAVSPFMISGIEKRLEALVEAGGYDERAAFEEAAWSMWEDHPFGVGANQYVTVANVSGYSDRAGVTWGGASRSANVHHAYLLAAAETGWLGISALFLLLAWPAFVGLRFAFRLRRDPRGDIALGFSVAIITVILHNFYEWVFVMYNVQYMFAIAVGVIAGLVRQRASESIRSRRKIDITGQGLKHAGRSQDSIAHLHLL